MEVNENIADGITLHPWQDKAWHSKKRFICFCSGVQGGKTFFGSIWIINEIESSGWSDFIILAPCYDKETEILTYAGWKYFRDLTDDDRVATLDGDEIVFKKPTERYEWDFDGELIGLKHDQIDLLVTPNHRIYCKKAYYNSDNKDWVTYQAKDIYGKRIKLKRWAEWRGGSQGDEKLYEFLGFWFAEGWAEYNEQLRKYRITLTQKKDVAYVDSLLNDLGIKYSKEKRQAGGFNWVIYNKILAKEFVSFGKALTKRIPIKVKTADVNSLRAFIHGFEKGDGLQGRDQRVLFTSSKQLADDLLEICIKCGYSATLRKRNYKEWKNPQYAISILKHYGREPVVYKKHWYKKSYKDKVYCVKIDNGEGILLVRRNGIPTWCGNTYKVLQQSTLQKFFEIVPRGYGVHNKSDSIFKTRTGKTIFFRSADKPESIEGITAGAIWADEVGLMKPDAWLFMQRRVSRTMGRILMTFTPKALNWVYYDLYRPWMKAKGNHSDIEFIQFRSVDSPYFPEAEFERAKQTMTEHQFKLSYEGEFAKAEGLVYPSFGSPNIVDDFAIPEDWRRTGGIDFGYINPFCSLEGALSPDDELYIYNCHYDSGMTLREHAKFLDPNITYFYDPSGRQEAEELISMGFELVPANNDIDLGINRVNVRIMGQTLSEDEDGLQKLEDKRRVRLKVFRSCGDLIEPMGLYQYDKNQTTGEWKDRPLKVNDHSPDALRYLVMGVDEYGTPEIMILG